MVAGRISEDRKLRKIPLTLRKGRAAAASLDASNHVFTDSTHQLHPHQHYQRAGREVSNTFFAGEFLPDYGKKSV
jgi:hypothetical protein